MLDLIRGRAKKVKGAMIRLVASKSEDPDVARREVILNVLLGVMLLLMSVAIVTHVWVWGVFDHPENAYYRENIMPLRSVLAITLFFAALLYLARRGLSLYVSYGFLLVFFLLAAYTGYEWGADVNVSLLFYMIVVIMSSVMVSTRFSFVMAALISLTLYYIGELQLAGLHVPNSYWRTNMMTRGSAVMYGAIFLLVASISWLSNREAEKALRRARRSESLLREERDLLEEKVEERTRELREMQAEKMVSLYRFAEFGRLSTGFFHDLMNPLNAVVLNVERFKGKDDEGAIGEAKGSIDTAIVAARKMEEMVSAIRRQMGQQNNSQAFSLTDEIRQVLEILSYKARQAGVEVIFTCPDTRQIMTFGDSSKFSQVVLNLVSNAIESYPALSSERTEREARKVVVFLEEEKGEVALIVQDQGSGILEENRERVFEPFFTTKGSRGMGVGLSMVKQIVEKDFEGKVTLESESGEGTTFIITFHVKQDGDGS